MPLSIKLAGCVIANEPGHVLLLHRNTPKLKQWELPGGKIKLGETPSDAAQRETREELGVDTRIIRWLGRTSFTQQEIDFEYEWFQATITEGNPVPQEPIHDFCDYKNLGTRLIWMIGLSQNVEALAREIQDERIQL